MTIMKQLLDNVRTSVAFLDAVKKKKTLPEWIKTRYPVPDFSAVKTAAESRHDPSGAAEADTRAERVQSPDLSLASRLELLEQSTEMPPQNIAWNLYFLARITHDYRGMCSWLMAILDAFMARQGALLSREMTCRMHAARSFALKHLMDQDPFKYAAEALDACLKAREYDFKEIDYDLWVLNLFHEGSFRLWQIQTNYKDNIERAIACSMELLDALHGSEWQKMRRVLHNNLGMAYDRRVIGNRADNLEQALEHYLMARKIAAEEGVEERFPSIINNLGYVYRMRIRGDKAENIETAIGFLQRARALHQAAGSRLKTAQTLTNLGVAYCDRLMGDRRENLYTAIRCYRKALRILNRKKHAGFRAWTLHNLGVAWHFLASDTGGEPLEKAIACYEEALTIRRPDQMPMDWLLTTRNLSRAYSLRTRGDIPANRRKALALLDGTLDVVPRDKHLLEWVQTHVYYGIVYARQVAGDIRVHLESAVDCFRKALAVLHPDTVPVETREAALWLGRVLIRLERFDEAEAALKIAADADRYRYRQMYISQSRSMEIETGSPVYFLLAHVLAAGKRGEEAIEWLEQGKIRMVTERLRLDQEEFSRLPEKQRDAGRELAARLQSLRIEHYIPGRPIDDIIRDTRQAQNALDALLKNIRHATPGFFRKSHPIKDFLAQLPEQSAVIEFNITEYGTNCFVMTPNGTGHGMKVIHNNAFNRDDMRRFIRNWLRRMNRFVLSQTPEGRASWSRYVLRRMRELCRKLMAPVYRYLSDREVGQIVFVPHLSMHLLPLHLMPSLRRRSGALLMDDFCVSYLPSITMGSLSYAAEETGDSQFLGVCNPTLDLPWSEHEVETIQSIFPGNRAVVLKGPAANPEAVEQEMPSAAFVHFACHARFDVTDPYRSYLALAAPNPADPISVTESARSGAIMTGCTDRSNRLINHRIQSSPFYLADVFSRVRLDRRPLVVLSCCESGLSSSPETADEFIGFAAGFMGSGARAVMTTHWPVDDRASCILMERFYRNIVDGTLSAPEALTEAQQYLRSLPEFSDPFLWGAFRIHGTV